MKTIISLADYKQAALYFDYVIPLSFWIQEMPNIFGMSETEMERHINQIKVQQILPEQFQSDSAIQDMGDASILTFKTMMALSDDPKMYETLKGMNWSKQEIMNEASDKLPKFMDKYHLKGLPYDSLDTTSENEGEDILISMPNMKFIDTEDLDWEKILEFRKDKESLSKLRLFRTFIFDNYQDKPKSYIEDDILRRLDDYNDTIKKWKFNTFHSCLQSALTSKITAGSISGTFLSALMNAPMAAIMSGMTGASIEIGKTVLEVSKCKLALSETLDKNPVSYIAKLKEL